MLSDAIIEQILDSLPLMTVGVIGDLFLDRYFEIDAALTEPSLETGLDAYQVTRVRAIPGAAGTAINNLAALGVSQISCVSIVGDDGEGFELLRALNQLRTVETSLLVSSNQIRTPTYNKPMLRRPGRPVEELNRLDIKNRVPLPAKLEDQVLQALDHVSESVDALLVLDQVSEPNCGVVTERVRMRLAELGAQQRDRLILADSRERIGTFRNVSLKPNQHECVTAVEPGHVGSPRRVLDRCATELARHAGRPVYCTCGADGILLVQPNAAAVRVPGYTVTGPIDVVGAGDSTSAAIACAVAAGATLAEAAAFGNLVASITIQQLGTTGTASPDQVRERWQEVKQGTSS